jgi:hypothetical protein
MGYHMDISDEEFADTLSVTHGLQFSWHKPAFRIKGTKRAFKGSPAEIMENTAFLENLDRLKKLMAAIDKHGGMGRLRAMWTRECARMLMDANVAEIIYREELFENGVLTQSEIDRLVRSLLDDDYGDD